MSTLGSGFSQPTAAAVDASGNLFVTDESNQAVYELTAASGYSTVITICTQFTIPTGVAVDANDNVFVTDQGTATVNELLASSNYATVRTLGSGFSNPNGVAVDASGDVFVADTLNNAIKEMIAVSGSIPNSPTINTLGGSYNHPTNLAVDSSGNVFVADLFNSAIKEIVAAGGYVTVNTLGSGFSYPVSVALDASDNVYVADSGNNAIKEILATGGYTTVNTLASSLPYPTGVAVNSAGNVYIANFSGSTVNLLTLFGGVGFGSLPVATSTPETIQLTFIFDTSGTIGAPLALTKGDTGLDFADAGTGTCTTNGTSHTYMAGDTCTVAASFTPTASGMRYGGVNLTTNGGAPIATEYVSGIGVGPQAAFSPGSQSSFAGSFLHPTRIAVDAAGNIFVAVAGTVSSGSFVQEILATGGYVTVNSLGSGYSYPEGVAVDGSGNVFVADTYNNAVEELLAAGGYTTMNTIGADFTRPYAVAVDRNGNVFVADTGNNAVKEILAAGGYTTVNTLGSGFSAPRGVAVDANGNVFVADTGNNAVKEILAAGGYTTINAVGASLGLYAPSDLSLDGNGNLYVITQFGIGELFAASGYTTGAPVFISVPQPVGITVDARGDVFVTDNQNSQIDELDVVDPPSFSFASTAVGATSSPQEAELINNGNAPLTIEIPTTGMNPSVSSGFSLGASTNCPEVSASGSAGTLAAGANCAYEVDFVPTAVGTNSGSLTLSDNNLNQSMATQSISLTGQGTAAPTTTVAANATAGYNAHVQTVMLSATVTSSYGTVNAGTVTFTVKQGGTVIGAAATSAALTNGTASVSYSLPAGTAAGTYTIAAVFNASGAFATSSDSTHSLTVNKASQTISFTQPTTPQTYASGLTIPLVATGGGSGNAVVFTLDESSTGSGTISGSTLTVTGAGTLVIDANQTGNGNYTAAAQAQVTAVIGKATQTIRFTQPTTPRTYASGLTVPLVATGGASGNAVVFSLDGTSTGTGTISGSTLTVTGAGTLVIDANQAGNGNYTAAAQAQVTVVIDKTAQTIRFTQPTTPETFAVGLTIPLHATGGASGNAVVFTLDGTSTGTGTISGSMLTVTGAGTLAIDANQAGNGNYSAATQAQVTVVVNRAAQTIDFTALASPVTYGVSPIALAATGGASGNAVTFSVTGPATVGSSKLTITGAGSVTVTANQAGDANYLAATAVVQTIVVKKATSATTLTSSVNPLLVTNPTIFTARVTSSAGVPAGSVSFLDGSTPLGNGTLASGVATLTTSSLAVGAHTITAVYSSDSDFAASASSALTETVSDFSVSTPSSGAGASQTVNPGGTATYTLDVTPTSGTSFPTVFTLALTGMPSGATATVTPTAWASTGSDSWSLPANTALAPITLTIELPATAAAVERRNSSGGALPAMLLSVLLLPFASRMRKAGKRLGRMLSVLLWLTAGAAAIAGLSGCGSTSGFFGQQPETYTMTETVTSGALSHSTTITLTVK